MGKRKFKAGYLPHFGMIFDISEEMIRQVLLEGIFRIPRFLIPWHRDPDQWDFLEMKKDEQYLLFVPKIYTLLCLFVLTLFIRLVPKT